MAPNAPYASDWISMAALLAMLVVVVALVASSRLPGYVKVLVCAGVGMRLVGAGVRYRVLWDFYNGLGDARGYYGKGVGFAEQFRQLDFTPIETWMASGTMWGTDFMVVLSGVVLTFIGHSMFTEFFVFSLFAFVGLVGFAVAYHRSFPSANMAWYLALVWLFPSLWYWPSSVGKEAVILMGLGLAVMGFVGRRKRVNWLLLAFGILVVFAVRTEVAGVLIVSMMIAHWLSIRGGWTSRRILQGVFLLGVGLVGLYYSMEAARVESFSVEGVMTAAEEDASRDINRGTNVEPVSVGVTGVPMAAFNILFRPLPWEATNVMVLVSSFEILTVWALVAWRRKNFMRSIRNWRSDRFVALSIVFVLLYSISLGMVLINLGIIARQRIFLFPFLFLLMEADTGAASSERPERRRRPSVVVRQRRRPVGAPL